MIRIDNIDISQLRIELDEVQYKEELIQSARSVLNELNDYREEDGMNNWIPDSSYIQVLERCLERLQEEVDSLKTGGKDGRDPRSDL